MIINGRSCRNFTSNSSAQNSKRRITPLSISKLALGSAYSPTVNDICANFLEANGYRVVVREGLNVVDNLEIGRLDVQTAYDLGKKIDRPEAEALVLACTNWKSMDIVERLERDIGKPVLSTTQVSIWGALRRIGFTGKLPGYGRLLRTFGTAKQNVTA